MVDNQQWLDRWRENRIGFHEGAVNRYLEKYLPQFGLPVGSRVFMPLCGKAHDIVWLAAKGYEVIGIELSQLAVEAFFEEQGLDHERFDTDRFGIYKSGKICLLQGDYFDLRNHDLAECSLVYDRASLIAMDKADRQHYCDHMLSIVPSTAGMLLITMEYQQNEMQGPPFAVSGDEVKRYYGAAFSIRELESNDILDERPRWREVGLGSLVEHVFRLDR